MEIFECGDGCLNEVKPRDSTVQNPSRAREMALALEGGV